MNTLLIESNRVIAQSSLNPTSADSETKTSISHTQVQDKASWTTSIETGIQLSPGDSISMQSAMMNIDGSTQGFQQFSGRVPTPDLGTHIYRKDNEMKVSLAFYTTNLIQNNCPLPMGRHMCETTDTLQGFNGAPCFTGRSLWRPKFNKLQGNIFSTEYTLLPVGWSGSFYAGRNPNGNTCPTSIKRNGNSFFFVGMNYNQPIIGVTFGPQPSPVWTQSCAEVAAFTGWTANVPFYGLTGVQFGSNSSTDLPQQDALGWTVGDPTTTDNLNRNVDFKDIYPNSGYFTGAVVPNGGAAPCVLLNEEIIIHPIITTSGGGGFSTGKLPLDWDEFNGGPNEYSYEAQRDSTFYKGSQYNYRPNGNRHFQPKIDVKAELCRGPYYSYDFNTLIDGSIDGDPDMDGMVNLHVHSRTNDYWKLQTSDFTIKLKTGNITPTRIAEIITELMKKQKGTAADPETLFVKQRTYQAVSEAVKDDTKDDLIILDQPNLSTQCYGLFPTMNGACLQSQKDEVAGSLYGWDCLTEENLKKDSIDDVTLNDVPGKNFNPKQAELKYWSLMMAGDYPSWSWGTYLNPLISYRPFTSANENVPGFNYQLWSVYTGYDNITSPGGFTSFHKRAKPDGSVSIVNIGNLGEFSCIQDTPRSGISQKNTRACAGVWNQINGTGNAAAPPYRINLEPYALWADPTAPFNDEEYRTLACQKYDIFPTNIVWDGQVKIEDWNAAFNELEGHNIVDSGNDTLNSQSNEFFDNTFVEWTIGRLDDAETYNELWIADDFGFRQKNQSQQGYAQYLPNIWQSNRMFNNDLASAAYPLAWKNIDDILTRASCIAITPGIQGTYTLYSKKVGTYKEGGSYTATDNPWSFPNASGSAYDPNKMGYPCWGVFKSEYELDVEKKNGFQKSAHRKIKSFRYLPQASLYNGYEYTATNAFNKNLLQPYEHYQNWSTRPATMPFEEYEKIFNKMKSLNNGKGLGIIPIFSSDNAYSNTHNNIPFVGVIYMDHEDKGMPLPEKGEWFGLSSPSLSQHDLSLPASTQKTPQANAVSNQQADSGEYTSGYVGQAPYFTGSPSADDKTKLLEASRPSNWATSYYTGSNDPVWNFNNTVNRYAYSQFHTPLFTGNGKWAYGDTGENASPETKEVRVVANTANFSRVRKLSYGTAPILANSAATQRPKVAEIQSGSIIADWTSPGGWYDLSPTGGTNWINEQYLSPVSCTQWEMRYLPIPGTQVLTGSTVAPPQTHKNATKDITSPSIECYAYITTDPEEKYPTVSSQGGVGILDLYVPRIGASDIKLTNTDFQLFNGTMFHKMGFDLGNFLPTFYQTQTQFNHTLFSQNMNPTDPAGLQYNNCLYPVCTQAIISSSLAPALTTGHGYAVREPVPSAVPNQIYPFYKTGMILRTAATNADSESMFASRLPQKLNFPYLVCRSNIATPCSLQYIGGPDGKQISPTVAVLATNYSTDDFFFTNRSDLVFTVTRPYILTEISTSIHLPNGDSADSILDENSAVIYRIDFAHREQTDTEILKQRAEEDKLLGVDEE